MNPGIKFFISSLFLLFCTICLSGQNKDFGIWSNIEVKKNIGDKFGLNGEFELRTRDNSSKVSRYSAGIGAEYDIFKFLEAGIAYKFIYFYDSKYTDYQPRNRFILYLQGKQKLGRFTFSLRERIQTTSKDESGRIKSNGNIDTYKINPELYWRNRIKVEYDIPSSRLTPYLSAESFYLLNNPEGNCFDDIRLILSFSYKINKHNRIELYTMYDHDISIDDPAERYVLGFGYSFSF
jgi:hypothetical protein